MCPLESWMMCAQGEKRPVSLTVIIVNVNMKQQISLSEAWGQGNKKSSANSRPGN